jgi:hypothetical protein
VVECWVAGLTHTKEYAPKFEPTARAKTAPYSVREETSGVVACHSCSTPRTRSVAFSRSHSIASNHQATHEKGGQSRRCSCRTTVPSASNLPVHRNLDCKRDVTPTLQPSTPIVPINQTLPATPPALAHAAHQPAQTLIQPVYCRASTRMNMENANGTSGRGRRVKTSEGVGKVREMSRSGAKSGDGGGEGGEGGEGD